MTNFIDGTGTKEKKKELKKTEFKFWLDKNFETEETTVQPEQWNNVELKSRKEEGGYEYDLFLAWDDEAKNRRAFYLGIAGDEFK